MIGVLLALQLSVTAALTGPVATSDASYHDREVFGVRYRTPPVAHVTLQAGLLNITENGILRPASGQGVRHWAVGLEWNGLVPWWRASVIYGNFDERRPSDRPLGDLVPLTYYRLVALGNEFTFGAPAHPYVLTIETLLSTPVQTHAALHDLVVRAHAPSIDAMVQHVHQSDDQAPYAFWTAEATWRPAAAAPPPWRYLGLQGGVREVPSYTADRAVPITFLGAGLFLSWRM